MTSLAWKCKFFFNRIHSDRKTRKLLYYLMLNISFTFVELFYGYVTNSLGLIGDSVHMFFDSSVVFANLLLTIVAKWQPTELFTFGFGRVEVLAGFVNSLLLLYASGSIFIGAIERLYEVQEIKGDGLVLVAVLGLAVNLVGIFAFDHGHTHHHEHDDDEESHCHDHHNSHLMHGE